MLFNDLIKHRIRAGALLLAVILAVSLAWTMRGSTADADVPGYEVVTARAEDPNGYVVDEVLYAIPECPSGKVALGGGIDAPWPVIGSLPVVRNGTYSAWQGLARADRNGAEPVAVVVYVICADIS